MPCGSCLKTQVAAARLRDGRIDGVRSSSRGKQLGRHERRVLLEAAGGRPLPPGRAYGNLLGHVRMVQPPERTASAQSATRRAVASLRAAGLIEARKANRAEAHMWIESLYYQGMRDRPDGLDPWLVRARQVTWAWRTALGEAIAQQYGPLLREPGRPIRWDARLDRALEAALATCPKCG